MCNKNNPEKNLYLKSIKDRIKVNKINPNYYYLPERV